MKSFDPTGWLFELLRQRGWIAGGDKGEIKHDSSFAPTIVWWSSAIRGATCP